MFCITLELSGPRQRLRLNDLLYTPLILTLNLCCDLDCTEPAEHYCTVCTMPTTDLDRTKTDFWNQWNRLLWSQKPTWKYKHPEETDKLKLPPILPASKTNHPLKLPHQRIIHETEYSQSLKPTDPGFHVLIFGFCITLELSGAASAVSAWMTCYVARLSVGVFKTAQQHFL